MTREDALEVKDILDAMSDWERWKYLLDNPTLEYIVFLDNAETYIELGHFEDEEVMSDFDSYIGWSDGVQVLLDELGIKYEVV